MPEQLDTQMTTTAPEHDQDESHRGPTPTQLAAVEAAYILEAVRK
jgi:hypothetical protein